jgi:hypothetical protein
MRYTHGNFVTTFIANDAGQWQMPLPSKGAIGQAIYAELGCTNE